MTLEELYRAYSQADDLGFRARKVLEQIHWFTVISEFDPKTGEALTQSLTPFLNRIPKSFQKADAVPYHDRLWRITEHCRLALERILFSLNESPMRDHAMLPIRAVRELDASSFIKLSNRPGRNIREKLAGKPYLQAVRRFQSVDLPENQLVKAFVSILSELLQLRKNCLREPEAPLIAKIENWLRGDEAKAISRWENLPPNNALLSHQDYRRVWDSWRWLQSIDDDTDSDFGKMEKRQEVMDFWQYISDLHCDDEIKLAEIPVVFNFEEFQIRSWTEQGIFIQAHGESHVLNIGSILPPIAQIRKKENVPLTCITTPVCADISLINPVYFTEDTVHFLKENFLWQKWTSNQEGVYELSFLQANAEYQGDGVTTISPSDLFFGSNLEKTDMNAAALAWAKDLHRVFKNETFIWLVPDYLNDFELEIIRKNINATFSDAEPLPRSVAAVFQVVDMKKIPKDGWSILVVDSQGGKIYGTKFVARFDSQLKTLIPETRGYSWERYPAVLLQEEVEEYVSGNILTFNGEKWIKSNPGNTAMKVSKKVDFSSNEELASCQEYFQIQESPVQGGMKLFSWQKRAENIPLWYDHLPELSTRIPQYGFYDYFFFVKRQKIVPQRGVTISINVHDKFTLAPNPDHNEYVFPLFKGSGESTLQYVASLKASYFPLKEPVSCSLKMTYTYGADQPYVLTFIPDNLQPITAEWKKKDVTTKSEILPAPTFPEAKKWSDFQHWPKKNGTGFSNLIDQVHDDLQKTIALLKPQRVKVIVSSTILTDKHKKEYCFVKTVDGVSVFCHSNYWDESIIENSLEVGKEAYAIICDRYCKNEKECVYMSLIANPSDKHIAEQIEKNALIILNHIHYPMLMIWKDGYSIKDSDASVDFRSCIRSWNKEALSLLKKDTISSNFKKAIRWVLCCMHKDCPKEVVDYYLDAFSSRRELLYEQYNIALLVGDVKQSWQNSILQHLIDKASKDIKWLSSISILLWRDKNALPSIDRNDISKLCNTLRKALESIANKKEKLTADRLKHLSENLEILLCLLITRNYPDKSVSQLFNPDNNLSISFLRIIDTINKIIIKMNLTLKTKVELGVQKPDQLIKTHDLLYALQMYLTGDSGANTICINGINDEE